MNLRQLRIMTFRWPLLILLSGLSWISAAEDIAFFEKTYGQKFEGVKSIEDYSDPDQFYSAIARQLGIPKVAGEAVTKEFGWKQDGKHVQQAIVRRGPGTWEVLIFQFALNETTGKPDVGTMKSVMVAIDDAGKMTFADLPGGGSEKPVALQAAREALQVHVENLLKGNFEALQKSYAKEVVLVAGGEYLKSKYGLAGDGGEIEPATVEREKLIAVMKEKGKFLPEKLIDELLKHYKYTTMKSSPGTYATLPPDPVATADGKVRFEVKKGDVVLKVGPEKGDFMLFQVRPNGNQWVVVAEYLD